jgi:hypothetical protein
VTNHILGGDASARLYMNLREARGYTYGSYSSLSSDKIVGRFNASASVRNEVTDSAAVEILNELKRMKQEKVSDAELELVKNNITGNFARSLESPQTIASFALNIERYNLPKDYYANYLKNVAAVSLDDVQDISNKYIKTDNSYIIVVGKADEISEEMKSIGEIEYYDIYGEKYIRGEASEIPTDLTAETVLDNYIKAVGGSEKIKAFKDIKISAKANAMGRDLEITNAVKNPDKALQSLSMGGMELQKAVTSGNKAVMYSQGQAMPMDENTIRDMVASAGIFPELRYKELGIQTKLKGVERVENKEVYVVEVTLPTGKTALHYFNKDSGLKVMETQSVESPQGEMTLTTEFSDYKEVEGVKFPHTIHIPLGGQQKMKAEVTSIEINTGLKDDFFKVQ